MENIRSTALNFATLIVQPSVPTLKVFWTRTLFRYNT